MAGPTSPELVAAVTNAGGLGIRGVSDQTADLIPEAAEAVRRLTKGPFGLNQLLAFAEDDEIPPVVREAILAAEDKDFFSHAGVDYGAFPRVAWKTLTSSVSASWRRSWRCFTPSSSFCSSW